MQLDFLFWIDVRSTAKYRGAECLSLSGYAGNVVLVLTFGYLVSFVDLHAEFGVLLLNSVL